MLIAHNNVANQSGNVLVVNNCVLNNVFIELTNPTSPNLHPIYGPSTNPSPKAAPISAKFFALFSGVDMSAIDDCATEMLPPVIPSTIREAKSIKIFACKIPTMNITLEIKVPIKLIASNGLLPNRSDNCPMIGAARNCAIA